jgi:2-amino-4-hydroxy-6-hydroxymethyldihydropteridine diphosphokinase
MIVLLSLGSNLGPRESHLAAAIATIEQSQAARVLQVSSCYETAPVGETDQPTFLNVAVEIETELSPLELLERLQDIERELGRTPTYRWGPRNIDIDIVLCEDQIVSNERLEIPHPRFRDRAFVLAPLAEIAPKAVDPVTGRTVETLAAAPEAQGDIVRRGPLPRTP